MFYVTHVWIIYLSDFSIHHNYLRRSKHWGFRHIQQQKVSSEHLAVSNTLSAMSDIIYYKKDIFCITKLSKLFQHLPLFHIIGASAQSLEELIQTFRCHCRAKKGSNSTIRGQNAKCQHCHHSVGKRAYFFFYLRVSKLVSKEQFSSLGFCIKPPNC